ncbi:MAG: transporter [Mycobacteriaceae bacterium]|nr:transporter [Mycobacteriaceae bacterium]
MDAITALVAASPAAVAAHDKAGWLRLWTSNHVIEDPVGSRPVLGGVYDRRSGDRTGGPLARFWDAFIGPNDITFEVFSDFVDGLDVVRDVTIHTTLRTGVTVSTPAHLLYQLAHEHGELKIRRMAAHWEPLPVFARLLRPTPAHVAAIAGMGAAMLRNLGPAGTARFTGAVAGVGRHGKAVVRDLAARAAAGDNAALDRLDGFVPRDLHKVIAGGDTVTARCTVDDAQALLLVTLNRRTLAVTEARLLRHTA